MPQVFISYSRRDGDFGKRLHTALTGEQRDVWMDWEDIPLTADWWQEIKRGIEASDNFVLIMSPDSIGSPICQLEIEHAIVCGKRIIPVFYRDPDVDTAFANAAERVANDEYVSKMLASRDVLILCKDNWAVVGALNWVFFGVDDEFEAKYAELSTIIDTDLNHVRRHTELGRRAIAWHENQREWSYLLTGSEIDRAETWELAAADKVPAPTAIQREYIRASRERQRRQQRLLLAGMSVAFVVSLVLLVAAILSLQEAEVQRGLAQDAAVIAQENENRALKSEQEALIARDTIEQQARQLNSIALAAEAEELVANGEPWLGLELAIEAATLVENPPPQAQRVLSDIGYAPGYRLRLDGHNNWVKAIATNADGTRAISGDVNGRVMLWDVADNAPLHHFTAHETPIRAVAMTQDGTLAAAASQGGQVMVWDVATGGRVYGWQLPVFINTIAFSPDNQRLAAGTLGTVYQWQLGDGQALATLDILDMLGNPSEIVRQNEAANVTALAYTPDGSALMVGTQRGNIHRFGAMSDLYEGYHTDIINRIDFTADGRTMLTASDDNTARIWDLTTESQTDDMLPQATVETLILEHTDWVNGAQFSADGQQALTSTCNDGLALWDVSTGERLRAFDANQTAATYNATFIRNGQASLYSRCESYILRDRFDEGDLIVWGLRSGAEEGRFTDKRNKSEKGAVQVLQSASIWGQATAGNARLVSLTCGSGCQTTGVTTWHMPAATVMAHMADLANASTVAITRDGQYVLSGTDDGALLWHNATTGDLIWQVEAAHGQRISAIVIAADGSRAVTSGSDHYLRLWDTANGEMLNEFHDVQRQLDLVWMNTLVFHPDGASLAVGLANGVVYLLPVAQAWQTWQVDDIARIDAPKLDANVRHVAFNSDGSRLAVGYATGDIRVFDVTNGAQLIELRGHLDWVTGLVYAPDDTWIASAGRDGQFIVWDAGEGNIMREYKGDGAPLTSLALLNDEQFVTGDANGLMTLWRFDPSDSLVDWVLKHRTITPEMGGVEPDWYEVYFTEPTASSDPATYNNAFTEVALIYALDSATKTIDVATFEMDWAVFADALSRAHERGVRVRILTDDETLLDDDSLITALQLQGIAIADDNRSALMHHKYIILDDTYVWTGSMNFTVNSVYRNNNSAIMLRAPELAASYQANFDAMFVDGQFNMRDTNTIELAVGDVSVQNFFLPEDGDIALNSMLDALNRVESSVRFLIFSFTLDDFGTALVDAIRRGASVEGVFERQGGLTQFSELGRLYCNGAQVRTDGNSFLLHHKAFIIDEQTVIISSANFSANAFERNNENILIINSPQIAGLFMQEWRRQYAMGDVPDAQAIDCAVYWSD